MSEDAPRQEPKVLLADDSKIVRVTAERLIGGDIELVLAESGEEAWAAITSDPEILVVFSDVSMPGLDGYGLLQRIREDERELVNQLPVIMVTGQDEDGAREQALENGATDFINKPFDRTVLMARAQAYATKGQLRRRAAALEESQVQDTVTGLGNARYFERRLKTARAFTLRHDMPLALIHVDFLGAREALREAGQSLAHRLREEDVLVHLGKGRFAAICPNCGEEGARPLAERLLEAVRAGGEAGDGGAPACVAVYLPPADSSVDLRTLYGRARETIDRARAQGDGSFVVEPESAPPADAGSGVESESESTPGLEEALALLDEPDGAERLRAHWPALLERCARLFEAAPAEVARPILGRLREPSPDEDVAAE